MIFLKDWKRNAEFTFSLYQTNSNFEKTISHNHTFVKEKKDIGSNHSISNFDLQKEGEFIVETNVKIFSFLSKFEFFKKIYIFFTNLKKR